VRALLRQLLVSRLDHVEHLLDAERLRRGVTTHLLQHRWVELDRLLKQKDSVLSW
tara:strand:- start:483 stop:647 length:165 start_codon:yes stop_codon:yes gene_type:complete